MGYYPRFFHLKVGFLMFLLSALPPFFLFLAVPASWGGRFVTVFLNLSGTLWLLFGSCFLGNCFSARALRGQPETLSFCDVWPPFFGFLMARCTLSAKAGRQISRTFFCHDIPVASTEVFLSLLPLTSFLLWENSCVKKGESTCPISKRTPFHNLAGLLFLLPGPASHGWVVFPLPPNSPLRVPSPAGQFFFPLLETLTLWLVFKTSQFSQVCMCETLPAFPWLFSKVFILGLICYFINLTSSIGKTRPFPSPLSFPEKPQVCLSRS